MEIAIKDRVCIVNQTTKFLVSLIFSLPYFSIVSCITIPFLPSDTCLLHLLLLFIIAQMFLILFLFSIYFIWACASVPLFFTEACFNCHLLFLFSPLFYTPHSWLLCLSKPQNNSRHFLKLYLVNFSQYR